MYIDFNKFNYDTLPKIDKNRFEERDKEAYKIVLNEWFTNNIDEFVNRKWEIEEIQYLKEIGDFINLIREAESLYELGFYTSCIALTGISAEDFSKYLSIRAGRNEHLIGTRRNGSTYDISQYDRLKYQLDENIISQSDYDELDAIRMIRNDYLHYNTDFKQKNIVSLKADSINSLNSLKKVLKNIIGTNPDANDFNEIFSNLFSNNNSRGMEDVIWKQKNILSHLFNFPITQDPDISEVYKTNFYNVLDIDDDEICLHETQINPQIGSGLFVYIDIDGESLKSINQQSITKGDSVFATIYSKVAEDGQTRLWYIDKIIKL